MMDNQPRHDLNPLIDQATPSGTLSNVADVLGVLRAVDLEESPNGFGLYLVLQCVEDATRHALAEITAAKGRKS